MQRRSRTPELFMTVLLLLLFAICFSACKGNLTDTIKVKRVISGIYEYAETHFSLSLDGYELDSSSTTPAGSTVLTYESMSMFDSSGKIVIILDSSGEGVAKIYDPLIIQLPNYVLLTSASYSCESGGLQKGSLVFEQVASVPVTPVERIYSEPGHKLYIVDFPDGVDFSPVGGEKRVFLTKVRFYDVRQELPDPGDPHYPVKIISTGKFTTNGETYYLPIYPVETDFSKLPPIIYGEPLIPGEEVFLPVPDMSAFPFPEELNYDLRTPLVPLKKIYFPHIDCSENWQSELALINNDSSPVVGNLLFYSQFGRYLDGVSVKLNAHGRREILVSEELGNSAEQVAYAVFEHHSANRLVGYAKLSVAGRFRTAIPAQSDDHMNRGEIAIPHIATSDLWWTRVTLINTNPTAKDVEIETNNNLTLIYSLDPGQQVSSKFSEMAPDSFLPGLSSAKIINGEGVVGVEMFGTVSGGSANYLSGVPLLDDTASVIYYPHTVSDEIWWTGVVAYNPQTVPADLTITPFSATGVDLSPNFIQSRLSVASEDKYFGAVAALNFPAETAWFKLESSQPLTGFELFGKGDGTQLAGYTSCNIDSKSGVFPKLDKDGWTGIAFVNIGESATVYLKAYNDAGQVVAVGEPQLLTANEKKVAVAGALFSEDISSATYITFAAASPIVGFQLNSSSDGMMLDGLPAL